MVTGLAGRSLLRYVHVLIAAQAHGALISASLLLVLVARLIGFGRFLAAACCGGIHVLLVLAPGRSSFGLRIVNLVIDALLLLQCLLGEALMRGLAWHTFL